MKKGFKSGLVIFIILILLIAGYTTFKVIKPKTGFSISYRSSSPDSSSMEVKQAPSDNYDARAAKSYKHDYIGAVFISGTIQEANSEYNQAWLLDTISSLKKDDSNTALAVYINSPGGAVYQADEVYLALQDYKTTGRPIYVYQGPMAASGGYYISCAANQIYANRNTLTGCIGVIMGTTYDLTGLFENLGIKSETVHSGKNKNMMNYNEPFTDEQREIMQSMCDECYAQFVNIVAKGRHLSIEKTEELSDGRLYTANQALSNGLIDHVDSWENMLRDLAENELEKPGIKVKYYKYQKKQTFVESMISKANELSTAKAAATLGLPAAVIDDMNNNSFVPMYLYK